MALRRLSPVGGGSSGLTLISTKTASASASLQFSGASFSNSYNTLFLNCAGLVMSSANQSTLAIVGEGAGPTWETGGHYTNSNGIINGTDIIGGPPGLARQQLLTR